MKLFTTTLALIAALSLQTVAVAQPAAPPIPKFRMRFMNAVPGMWKLDLRLSTHGVFQSVTYSRCTGYVPINEGTYMLHVTTPRNQTTVIGPEVISFDAGIDYTAIVTGSISGDPPIDGMLVEMPRLPVPYTDNQFLLINTIADGGDYDFVIDGNIVSTLGFEDYDVPVLPQGRHTIELQQGGSTVAGPVTARMPGGKTYTVVAIGTEDPGDGLPLQLRILSNK